jgi:hypothetical protein
MLVRVAFFWCCAFSAGCFPCPQKRVFPGFDGGAIECVRSTDCPVEAGTLTCTMTQDRLFECIGCENGQCVRWLPEACR